MDMQDKEFDKLFNSKLNGLEFEPSKSVWQGIDEGLGSKRRNAIIPLLSIAASIIVLIAAGIVFYPKHPVIVKPNVKGQTARIKHVKIAPAAPTVIQQTVVQVPKTVLAAVNKTVQPNAAMHTKGVAPVQQQVAAAKNNKPVNAPAPQTLIAETSHNILKQAVISDSAKAIAAVPVTHPVDKQIFIAAVKSDPVPNKRSSDTTPVKKHRIHSFGDMLNVAIAAVDKRKDKMTLFQDGDND